MKIQLKASDITYRDLNPVESSKTLKIILELMIVAGFLFLGSAVIYMWKIIAEIYFDPSLYGM